MFLHDELKKLSIHPSEFPYIMALLLVKDKGILQDELTKLLGMARSGTSKALQSLEERGFIVRSESEHSKRHKKVFPLEKLLALDKPLTSLLAKWKRYLHGNDIESAELKSFNITLAKMSKCALQYDGK